MYKSITTIVFLTVFILSNARSQSINLDDLPAVEDYTFLRTNENADTVVLVLHGGPSSELYEGGFTEFEEISTFSVVEVMKSEMLSQMMEKSFVSYAECIATNDTTAALIQKSVLHYKALDKFVVLVGHSWGAIVMGEYLDDYGNEYVDKIIPMCGRLSAPLEFVDYLKDGFLPRFTDGITLTVDTGVPNPYPNVILLAAAAFENRWTDSLEQLDLSNLLYTHAEFDEATGRLLPQEVDFLENSGAQIQYLVGGDHSSVFSIVPHQVIFNFIRESNPMVSVEKPQLKELSLYPTLTNTDINLSTDNDGELYIFDYSGNQMTTLRLRSGRSKIDVSQYNSGQYIAIFKTYSGQLSDAKFQVIK